MAQATNTRSLALVAGVLSEDYGVKVTMYGNTAGVTYTKLTRRPVINIPAVETSDKNYLTMVRGFIDHEAGHVRFSQPDKIEDAARRSQHKSALSAIAGILDDIQVEKKMGECFPGCKTNLSNMAKLVYDTNRKDALRPPDFIKSSTDEQAEMLWQAITQHIAYRTRAQSTPELQKYLAEYQKPLDRLVPGLTDQINPIIDRAVDECVTTEKSIATSKEIIQTVLQYFQMQPEPQEGEGEGEGGGEGQEGEGSGKTSKGKNKNKGGKGSSQSKNKPEKGDSEDEQDKGEDGDGDGDGDGEQEGQDTQESGGNSAGNQNSNQMAEAMQHAAKYGEDLEQDVSEQARAAMERAAQKADISGYSMTTAGGAGADSSELRGFVSEMPDSYLREAEQESAALDNQLQSLLQTYVMNRGGAAQQGRLDTNQLHKLVVNNPRVFRRRVEKRGIDTEMVIIVDMSGSMDGSKCIITSKALYAILKSLRRIQGVKSCAIGFCGRTVVDILGMNQLLTTKTFIRPQGGTLCGEALLYGLQKFTRNPDSRKIVVMLTDGDTDNEEFFTRMVSVAKESGVEMVGIGIQDHAIAQYLQPEEVAIINNLRQLSPALFKILRTKLLGGN